MEKKINLDEILEEYTLDSDNVGLVTNYLIKRAILKVCRQTLELAAEKAGCYDKHDGTGEWSVNRQSILDLANQIE